MQSLFSHSITPLASLLRPEKLDDLVGQSHLIGPGKPIRKFIEAGRLPSILLWGPPGCGKTSLARVISKSIDAEFFHLSAVLAKKEDVVKIIGKAQKNFSEGRQTILFLDEIHRWSKSQQDVLLPWVEKGIITLIGATTENPSFTVINALLSRCRTYILEPIKSEEVEEFLMKNLLRIEERYPHIVIARSEPVSVANDVAIQVSETESTGLLRSSQGQEHESNIKLISKLGGGDLRNTLNLLETACILQGEGELTRENILEAGSKSLMYDQDGEEHYNAISAMHKSLRDSDGDAAIYWIGRMLAGGEDPRYIARRMINFASEDVFDPTAMILANATYDICEKMGMPECELPIMNTAYYLADLPKDNRVYRAMQAMHDDVKEYGNLAVPIHLRNAPTELMKEAGYGKGYEYAHDLKEKKSSQEHFPEELKGRKYRT
ncbi:replication-associated recombination protein A [Candidatus Gracilibacteria bacterium]|nr:replication-associated recombination protein A [Candidatus Gracilibacteria bacterium]